MNSIDYAAAGLMPDGQGMILDMLKNDSATCKKFMAQINWSIYTNEIREKLMLIYANIVKTDKDIPNIIEVVSKIEQSFSPDDLKQFMNQITNLKCGTHKENECCDINKDKFALLSFLGEYIKASRYYIGKVLQEACYAGHKSCVNEILNGFISYPSCCIAALQLNEKSVKNLSTNKLSQELIKYFTNLLFEKLKQSGGVYSMISWAQTKGCENIMFDLAKQHGIDVDAALKIIPKSRRRHDSDSPNKQSKTETYSPNKYLKNESHSPNKPEHTAGIPRMGNYQRRYKDDSANWRSAQNKVLFGDSPSSSSPNSGSPRFDISPPRNKSPSKSSHDVVNVLFPYGQESPLNTMTGPVLMSSQSSTIGGQTPSLFAYQQELKKQELYIPPARR